MLMPPIPTLAVDAARGACGTKNSQSDMSDASYGSIPSPSKTQDVQGRDAAAGSAPVDPKGLMMKAYPHLQQYAAADDKFSAKRFSPEGHDEREPKKPRADPHFGELGRNIGRDALGSDPQSSFGRQQLGFASVAAAAPSSSSASPSQVSNNNSDILRFLLSSPSHHQGPANPGLGSGTSLHTSNLLREHALRAEISAQELLQRQALQDAAAANAFYNFSLNRNPLDSFVGSTGAGHQPSSLGMGDLSMFAGLRAEPQGLQSQFSALASNTLATSNVLAGYPRYPGGQQGRSSLGMPPLPSSLLMPPGTGASHAQNLSSLLQQLQAAHSSGPGVGQGVSAVSQYLHGDSVGPPQATSVNPQLPFPSAAMGAAASTGLSSSGATHDEPSATSNTTLTIPPCDEDRVSPFSTRPMYKLGIDEDPNWLSEFHCFVRSELIEVFRASREDCKARNNAIAHHQVGIRCRFCAHISPNARAGRSSAFPSSLRQIYQSFTMMLRDHFGNCEAMPRATQDKFLALKDKPSQGATDSKRYWVYSAMKIGMADSRKGIVVTEATRAQGMAAPPFGTSPAQQVADDGVKDVALVLPTDRTLVSEFLFLLMSQSQLVRLTDAERVGNRRSLRLGLPGFGCRFCCEHRRLGLCRMFPARRRTLPSKVSDLFDHLRRCTVCPSHVKERLESLHHQMNIGFHADQGGDREFFDRVWSRLGHGKA